MPKAKPNPALCQTGFKTVMDSSQNAYDTEHPCHRQHCTTPCWDYGITLLADFAQKRAAVLYVKQSLQVVFISSQADKAYRCSLV